MSGEARTVILVAEPSSLNADVVRVSLRGDRFSVRTYGGTASGLLDALDDAMVLVIGESMSRDGLMELVPRIVARGVRILVLSADGFDDAASDLLLAGATGFLSTSDAGLTELADAVSTVARGLTALNAATAHEVLQLWRRQRETPNAPAAVDTAAPELTTRERDVLAALTEGLGNRLTARRLGIAEKTVEAHKSKLFAKLGARNQAHAVQLAIEQGLI